MSTTDGFLGYRRVGRGVGIRNYTVLACISPCAEGWVRRLRLEPHERVLPSRGACTFDQRFLRDLCQLLLNPNVGAVLTLSMGCDSVGVAQLTEALVHAGMPHEHIVLADFEEPEDFLAAARPRLDDLRARSVSAPELCPLPDLFLGAKCGGSDYSNGLFSNPLVHDVFDLLIAAGARCLVSEVAEYTGLEDQIRSQFTSLTEAARFEADMQKRISQLHRRGAARSQMVEGNRKGGLTTIEEKALGSAAKFAGLPITGCLAIEPEYERPRPGQHGLFLQLGSHQEPEVFTEMALAGCVGALFTTGRGGGFTHPLVPLLVSSASHSKAIVRSRLTDIHLPTWTTRGERKRLAENYLQKILDWASGAESAVERESLFTFSWPERSKDNE